MALLNGGKMKDYKGAMEMIVATNGKVSLILILVEPPLMMFVLS
jgi:hypothetical protein